MMVVGKDQEFSFGHIMFCNVDTRVESMVTCKPG